MNLSPEIQEQIQNWMKDPKHFLIFLGSPGIGKTYLCAALYPWAYVKFQTFRHFDEATYYEKITSSFDLKGSYIDEIKDIMNNEYISLDDIGSVHSEKNWHKNYMFQTINARYESMKPTVITSNLTLKDFGDKYEPRVMSRLNAKENIIINLHNGIDLRAPTPEEENDTTA